MRGFLQILIFHFILEMENFACHEICNLPRECKTIESNSANKSTYYIFECDLLSDRKIEIEKCPQLKDDTLTEVYLDSNSKLTIDNTSLASIIDFFNSQTYTQKKLAINKIRGLNIESNIQVRIENLFAMIFHSMPDLVDQQGNVVKDCEDFERLNYPSFFLKTNDSDKNLAFEIDIFDRTVRICELFFNDAQLSFLSFNYLANTYFKKRRIEIEKTTSLKTTLKSKISMLSFGSSYEIDLNEKMFNENLFKSTIAVWILGTLNSIKSDYFTHFESLIGIEIPSKVFLSLVHRQGIDWIKNMNRDVNVDLANETQVIPKKIKLSSERDILRDENFKYVYDEDFCLLKDFPIHQMVFLLIDNTNYILGAEAIKRTNDNPSCTLLWMYRFNFYFYFPEQMINLDFTNYQKCNFKTRIQNCNISGGIVRKERERTFNVIDFMILSEFLVIIASPLISVFGIVTNGIIILVIIKKENRKTLNQKQYTYIAIHSVSNIFICFIEILNLVNQCQLPFGIYCSTIRYNVVIQYFKIIFGEYFSCFFRLFSNFTYVAFALNRLSLIGNNPNKVTKFFSELGIKKFIAFSIIVSAAFPVVKPLRYQINTIAYERYMPVLFFNFTHFSGHETIYKLLIIFNSVYDIVNYILFVLLNLILDILLIKKLREAMREREEKVKDQIEAAREKVKKENDESFRRVIFMVVLSSLVNFLLKLPIVITSLNDLRYLITTSGWLQFDYFDDYNFEFSYSFSYFCYTDKICMIFFQFGNFLFLISLSVNFFFLKRFDKNFYSAYELFKAKKSKK